MAHDSMVTNKEPDENQRKEMIKEDYRDGKNDPTNPS